MTASLDGLHLRIDAALDLYPSECWTVSDCQRILECLTEIAANAFGAELDEVGL